MEISAAVTWAIILFHMCCQTEHTHKSFSSNKNKHHCAQIKTSHSDGSVNEKVAPTPPRYITNAEKYAKKAFLLQPHLHSPSQPTHTHTQRQNINTHTLPRGQIHLHTLTPTQIGCHRQTRRLLINKMKWNAAARFHLIFQRIVRIICYICILSKHHNNQKYNFNTNKHQPD